MNTDRYSQLKSLDHRYLWHPFTQMQTWLAEDPVIIERGEGNYLIDVEGRRYLDGVSSLWCNVHGHRRPELDDALKAQIDTIAHSTMLGLAHVGAIELARELIEIAPKSLKRVFYSDSGAEAVEVACRMAAQFWQMNGAPGRTQFVTLTESYHGDTLGSVSLGYSEQFHRHLRPMLFPVLRIDPPHVFRFMRGMDGEAAVDTALEAARKLFARHGDTVAALVIEPLMQGAAGMWSHSVRFLQGVTQLAREAGALVVCDEVATGFGRTGEMFACEHAGVEPDVLCLGKGITGGYLPLAATLTTERLFEGFLGQPSEYKAFFYGHTYTGNPLGCAVALANLKLFREQSVISTIQPLVAALRRRLHEQIAPLPHVADIRQWGLMVGIELMEDPARKVAYHSSTQIGVRVIKAARKAGVIIRPLGNVIVLMPPLSITAQETEVLLGVVGNAIREVTDGDSRC